MNYPGINIGLEMLPEQQFHLQVLLQANAGTSAGCCGVFCAWYKLPRARLESHPLVSSTSFPGAVWGQSRPGENCAAGLRDICRSLKPYAGHLCVNCPPEMDKAVLAL